LLPLAGVTLVSVARAHGMRLRGRNRCWHAISGLAGQRPLHAQPALHSVSDRHHECGQALQGPGIRLGCGERSVCRRRHRVARLDLVQVRARSS